MFVMRFGLIVLSIMCGTKICTARKLGQILFRWNEVSPKRNGFVHKQIFIYFLGTMKAIKRVLTDSIKNVPCDATKWINNSCYCCRDCCCFCCWVRECRKFQTKHLNLLSTGITREPTINYKRPCHSIAAMSWQPHFNQD